MYPYQGGWEGSLLKNQSKGTYSTRMGLGLGLHGVASRWACSALRHFSHRSNASRA
jgi:hypothetical protein